MHSLARIPRTVAASLALLLAAGACRNGGHAQSHAEGAIDWASVSNRDLDIASVFLVARDVGVRQALDSLQVLTDRDPSLEPMGHALAHGLGRYAIAQHGYDIAVFAQCRPTFLSGCYHGVLEGYLSANHGDASALRGVCTSAAIAKMPPYAFRECAHGMGHGLSGMDGHDLFAALGDCDRVLPDGVARRECYDGVFMENVVHSLGTMDVNVGDAMAQHHAHAEHDVKLLKPDDPYFPCDSIAAPGHQPSCWAYQPVVFFQQMREMDRVVRGCDQAPAASQAACFRGLGKQTMGWMPEKPDSVMHICRTAGAAHTGDCIAGAVEYFVDREWKADRAFAFCAKVPAAEKDGCYRAVGERVAWIDPAPDAIRSACAAAGAPAYAATCVSAAESEHAAETVARAAAAAPPPSPITAPHSAGTPHDHGAMPMPHTG
jgi:hypothetical protein